MRPKLSSLVILLCACIAGAAPAPYPIDVNSRAQSAPAVTCYRANSFTIRATYLDGQTASDLTGAIPFLSWATNTTAASVSTSSWAFVGSPTNGIVDFTFAPASVNFTPGRYIYEVGVKTSNSVVSVYRQGVFFIVGSPTAAGVGAVNWTTSLNWDLIDWTNLPSYISSESDPVAYAPATNALALASTALQPGATNGLLRAEADTLATVTARGATTTNAITAQNFIGGRYGFNAGANATGNAWGAYGYGAGANANGNSWGAYGVDAGYNANGNSWGAYGVGAGFNATGNDWGAYGRLAGLAADHNNSHAFGRYAGYTARGDSRLYIDVYAADPRYAADGAINDRIFGDTDGKLYLGRGEGAPGGAVGGTLRGPWTGGGFASYRAVTNIAAAAVAGSGHAMAEQVVSGAVCTASAGNRYFWTSATNVVLSVNLTSGQVVNLAKLNNTATNSITAIGQAGWEWTGGDMTNTIAAGKSMTFGFLVDAATGKTNAFATGVSK